MAIKYNGGDNPTAIKFVKNGTTTSLTKVVFVKNGTSTTVWQSFPETIGDITITMTDGSKITLKSIRFQYESTGGSGQDLGVYSFTISASLPISPQYASIGVVDTSSGTLRYDWKIRSISGVPSGYAFSSVFFSPRKLNTFLIDQIGMAVIDVSKLVRASRETMIGISASTKYVTMYIYYDPKDIIYYATGNNMTFTGSGFFNIERS